MHRKILILGLGNTILRDEGLGVHAVAQLRECYQFPPGVEILDGGTLGLALLPYLAASTDLLIVDAVQTGQAPGTLVRLADEEIPAALAVKMSVHQIGLQELLAVSKIQGSAPPRMVLWGMTPAAIEPGLALTDIVAARLDRLVDAVAGELEAWGVALTPTASA
jgi:hydrogenase maturation protease